MTIVVSEELRSLSAAEGVSSGTDDPDAVVLVESGDGCWDRDGCGVGGMRINDGGSIRLESRCMRLQANKGV